MNETVSIILGVYGGFAVALLILGAIWYKDAVRPEETRNAARVILAALVWPLALVLVVVKGVLYWAPRLWREAWSE